MFDLLMREVNHKTLYFAGSIAKNKKIELCLLFFK